MIKNLNKIQYLFFEFHIVTQMYLTFSRALSRNKLLHLQFTLNSPMNRPESGNSKNTREATRDLTSYFSTRKSFCILIFNNISVHSYWMGSRTYPSDVFNILVRPVRESERRLDTVTLILCDWLNSQQFDSGQ